MSRPRVTEWKLDDVRLRELDGTFVLTDSASRELGLTDEELRSFAVLLECAVAELDERKGDNA